MPNAEPGPPDARSCSSSSCSRSPGFSPSTSRRRRRRGRPSRPARARASTRPAPETVEVAFVNGWIVRVERVVPKRMAPAETALRELTQGPTKAERRTGNPYRTARECPAPLAAPDATTWFASFSRSTLGAGSAETKRTRLWQIAATLAPLGEKEFAAIATEGRFVTTLRLGVRPGTWRAETGENDYPYVVRGVQLRLARSAISIAPTPPGRSTTSPSRRSSPSRGGRISTARAP